MRGLVRARHARRRVRLEHRPLLRAGQFHATEEVIELREGRRRSRRHPHLAHARRGVARAGQRARDDRIGEEGGLPTQITHHKIIGQANWGKSVETLKLVDEARARGVDVTIDQYPYTASSTNIASRADAAVGAGRRAQAANARKRLKDPPRARRSRRRSSKRSRTTAAAATPRTSCSSLRVRSGAGRQEPGRTHARRAARSRRSRMPPKPRCGSSSRAIASAVYHAIDEEDVRAHHAPSGDDDRLRRRPAVFGQAAPHPRSYGTFARVLGVYVREKNVLTLEDAVRRMSSYPAARLGLSDRGMLRPGMKADIVVFDPATVRDMATFEKPHQYAGRRSVRDRQRPGGFRERRDDCRAAGASAVRAGDEAVNGDELQVTSEG